MAQADAPSAFARYLPTTHILRRFAYTVLAMWLAWFALFAWLTCTAGCTNLFWAWMLAASLAFGIVFASYVWALPASLASIAKLLGSSNQPTWLGSWPQPVGIAIFGWLVSVLGLFIFVLILQANDAESPFSQWYLGFVALFLE